MSNEFTGQNRGYERPLVSQNKETENNYGQVRPVWTELMEEMLIYYIRASRLLWDTKHPLFTKPSVKRRKVEDITAIINREAGISDEQALSPEPNLVGGSGYLNNIIYLT
ncbi:hypothetical protein SK128_027312 [Halocaridina rubra]|uniref:MADF domain-containing protein n=1 Tax=Halocaridina rubra TaxID=373956 RepID=A0AAN9A2F3_HALRR